MKTKLFIILLLAGLLAGCKTQPGETTSKSGLELVKVEPLIGKELPESSSYREEFDKDISGDWGLKVVSGLEKQVSWTMEKSHFRVKIPAVSNDTTFIFLNTDKNYKDIVVQAEVEYLKSSDNFVSVICRASEDGWYEFRMNSLAYYQVLKFDTYRQSQGGNAYTDLVKVQMRNPLINTGKTTNQFAISCVGNQITVFLNGEQVFKDGRPLEFEDSDYQEGAIGFGISSDGSSADVSFNWVEALKP